MLSNFLLEIGHLDEWGNGNNTGIHEEESGLTSGSVVGLGGGTPRTSAMSLLAPSKSLTSLQRTKQSGGSMRL